MNLYKMADLTTIWVDVEVFEHQVEAMRVGQRARIELPYLPGRPYTGFVRYLYPHFDEQTRTMTVSIELENPDLTLRAGMYANVTFDVPVARSALAVPEEAVIRGGTRDLVVLQRSPGTFQVAAVTLGRYGDGVWEVLDGIDDGDTIVLSAQFLIDSESNLTAAIRNSTRARTRPRCRRRTSTVRSTRRRPPASRPRQACRTAAGTTRKTRGRRRPEPTTSRRRRPATATDGERRDRCSPGSIEWSIGNRFFVVLGAVLVAFGGVYALRPPPSTRCRTCRTCR